MDERESAGGLPLLLGSVAGAGAAVLILGLLAFSFYHALDGRSSTAQPQASAPRATATPVSHSSTVVTQYSNEPIERSFFVFILCDGETVEGSIYSGIIYDDYVALVATPDHDLILDLIQGKPTILPARSRIFESTCARRMFGDPPGA